MNSNEYYKFYYSILCSVIGDIIGYGNGSVEFNYGHNMKVSSQKDIQRLSGISVLHVVNFIRDGGLGKYDPSKEIVSDDTILILATLERSNVILLLN